MRKRAGNRLPPNGARARCTHDRVSRSRCRTGDCPAWLALRGDAPGPLLAPVGQTGAIDMRPMTAQALMMRLPRRAKAANIGHCSPHDLRRSFVSTALESGADLAMVQALAGHASPVTTARYDRRPEHAKAEAAKLVHVPFVAESGA